MGNLQHIEILKSGVKNWNAWRSEHIEIFPDLHGANLSGLDLTGAFLSGTNLAVSDLCDVKLCHAQLQSCYSRATSAGVFLSNHIYYRGADLSHAVLRHADLDQAILGDTIFFDTDLSGATNLDTCRHQRASMLDHRTVWLSGELPISFLQGCGLPDNVLNLLRQNAPDIKYYSCFISFASQNMQFSEKLYRDLQSHGVRCWFAPADMPLAAKLRETIDEMIGRLDKLLVVLSFDSVQSQWVEQETASALERERTLKQDVIIPIRIDDCVMRHAGGWSQFLRNTRNIGDFTRWQDHSSYNQSLLKLLACLRISQ